MRKQLRKLKNFQNKLEKCWKNTTWQKPPIQNMTKTWSFLYGKPFVRTWCFVAFLTFCSNFLMKNMLETFFVEFIRIPFRFVMNRNWRTKWMATRKYNMFTTNDIRFVFIWEMYFHLFYCLLRLRWSDKKKASMNSIIWISGQ